MSRNNFYGHQEGLPEADDYAPEEIGNATIEAGEPEQTWEEYGLELVPIKHDGVDTGRRFIRRNGKYIADVSNQYKLLPNERAVAAANEVAQELGAVPFHEFDGDWFVTLDDHVFQDPDGRRVHAVYAWDQGEVGGDTMEYGFAVHNSIDASMGFRVGLFSFKHACANMVMIGTGTRQEQGALAVEQSREALNTSMRKHTKGLGVDKDALEARIHQTLDLTGAVHERYEEMVGTRLDPTQARGLISRLPFKNLPPHIQDLAEDLEARRQEAEEPLSREESLAFLDAGISEDDTVWETYNDVTESIWHDESTGDQTKRSKMNQLHRVTPVIGD